MSSAKSKPSSVVATSAVVREGYTVEFKREVAEFAIANSDWPNTEVGKKFNVSSEYVRRWVLAYKQGRLALSQGTKLTTNAAPRVATIKPLRDAPVKPRGDGRYVVEGLKETFGTIEEAKSAALEAVFTGKLVDVRITKEVVMHETVFELVQPPKAVGA